MKGTTNVFDAFFNSWKIMLVDWDLEWKSMVGKAAYFGFSMFLIVIMLNLLIAVISKTHDQV